MDSWSRPSKHAATPPPLYLLPGGYSTPYCHSCGRVIGSRKIQTAKSGRDIVKYCSERCRHRKPDETDRTIEDMFVSLLNGEAEMIHSKDREISLRKKDKAVPLVKKVKGDSRVTVLCSTVEELVFGSRYDSEKVFGRKKNRAKRGTPDAGQWKSVDMEDNTPPTYDDTPKGLSDSKEQYSDTLQSEHESLSTFGAGKARPAQDVSDVNFSVGGERGWVEKIEETEELKQKRLEGRRRADEREAIRRAARRLCAFGVVSYREGEQEKENGVAGGKQTRMVVSRNQPRDMAERTEQRKKCEAVLKEGTVVEASFAKGEWGIRWRE